MVASREVLMTLRKDFKTVGKDHKMGFLREYLRVRESYSFVRLGSGWEVCDAFLLVYAQ